MPRDQVLPQRRWQCKRWTVGSPQAQCTRPFDKPLAPGAPALATSQGPLARQPCSLAPGDRDAPTLATAVQTMSCGLAAGHPSRRGAGQKGAGEERAGRGAGLEVAGAGRGLLCLQRELVGRGALSQLIEQQAAL